MLQSNAKFFNFIILRSLILLSFLLIYTTSFSQDSFKDKDVLSSYKEYVKLPRELIYAHLNKSTYIKGELIGFNAYVLGKSNKRLSTLTKNLYCVITDKDEKIIKRKLIKVENGISSGLFIIDSLFTSGEYIFKAYTNWTQNFDEQNFFVQTIRVIDPEIELIVKPKVVNIKIDAQFLPEGGHLVADIKNTIGVVFKDDLGFGIPFVEGQLFEHNTKIITNFKVNKLGIGRFSFTPNSTKNYQVKINYLDQKYVFDIGRIESQGIVASLKQSNTNNITVSFKTNDKTLPQIKNKNYKLIIHNGEALYATDVIFNDKVEVNNLIDLKYLFSGINIFTLFDDNNNPLIERLFFNYEGIEFVKSDKISIKKELDSLAVKLSYQTINLNEFNNISISVLPEGTKSYQHHHNLTSYALLQPYVKGAIENAQYYFTEIDRKKQFELDNLLLTQGWSSYSWNRVFNYPPDSFYAFENGIGFIANAVNPKLNKFVLYPIGGNGLNYFTLAENEKSFQTSGLFPIENEKFNIAEMKIDGELKPPRLYLQFFPSKIPKISLDYNYLDIKQQTILDRNRLESFSSIDLKRTQELEEVVVTAKVEQTRIEKIKTKAHYGRVDVFDDLKRGKAQNLTDYLRQQGYNVFDEQGNLRVANSDARSIMLNGGGPIFYLDGKQVFDLSILSNYDMQWVDYVEINKHGVGEGIRGGNGVIKIFTLPITKRNSIKNVTTLNKYDIPLTFSAPKKFYVPKYRNYSNAFFNEYGVIDWLPTNKIDSNGNFVFKIFNTKTPSIKLYIQGVANNGSFVSEVKTINL